MKTLHIHLLGRFSLFYDDTLLTSLNTPRLQALFAFLVLHRNEPQSRQQLAFQFWPDSNEAQARTNLRNLIHLLHKFLPDSHLFIRNDLHTIQWRSDSSFILDSLEFESCLTPRSANGVSREQLERAINHYTGDLLPGCYEDWVIPERERLHQAFVLALQSLAEIAESTRDYRSALDFTRRLLLTEPLHPRANQRLIRFYSLLGDRPAAIKAYQAYSSLLEHELGIRPDQEIQELYQNIKSQTVEETIPQLKAVQFSLVGRQSEWQTLQATWRSAKAGSPRILFVKGEAGIGKTRLVEELVTWLSRQGIPTSIANCYPAEGSLPFAPVVSWLRSRPIPHLDAVWLTEISRLLPELIQKYPKLILPTPLTEAWQRHRLFEALARAVLANRTPQMLLIEDIHWCDQDTLEWLHYLLRFDSQAPILVVATERSEEIIAPDHPVQIFKMAITGTSAFSEIELRPLGLRESFQLATQAFYSMMNQPLGPGVADSIYQQTEGNPLYIVEMIRLGYFVNDQKNQTNEPKIQSDKIQNILTRRINQISPATRELLSLAATIGREFHLDILLQTSEKDQALVINSTEELVKRRIIQEILPEVYDFTHDRLRQAAFDGLSTAHRRLLHRKVAEAYLELSNRQAESRHAEIAVHYEKAGLILPAINFYLEAANAAKSLFANLDAIHYLQHAIALVKTLDLTSHRTGITYQELAQIYETLGDLLALTGNYDQALNQYMTVLNLPFNQTPVWKSSLNRKISAVQVSLYNPPDAYHFLDLAEQCLHKEANLQELQEWINVQLARGQLYYWDNELDEMHKILQNIQPFIEEYSFIEQSLELLSIDFQYHVRRERYRLSKTTIDLAQRRLELCLASGDHSSIIYANFQLGFALLWGGEVVQALGHLESALVAAEEMGARTIQARCLAYLCIAQRKLKLVEKITKSTEGLLTLTGSMGEYAYQGVAWANKAWLAWLDGNDDKIKEFGQEALNCWHKYPSVYVFHWLALWPMLAVSVTQGHLEQAELFASKMLDPEQQPLPEPLPQLLENAIQARKAGDYGSAIVSFRQALEAAKATNEL